MERMDVIAAYESVGTYRGAAELCGTTHKTVKRIVTAHQAEQPVERKERGHNYDEVAELVAERGGEDAREDLGEAAVAGGAGGGLCRVAAELPPAGRGRSTDSSITATP